MLLLFKLHGVIICNSYLFYWHATLDYCRWNGREKSAKPWELCLCTSAQFLKLIAGNFSLLLLVNPFLYESFQGICSLRTVSVGRGRERILHRPQYTLLPFNSNIQLKTIVWIFNNPEVLNNIVILVRSLLFWYLVQLLQMDLSLFQNTEQLIKCLLKLFMGFLETSGLNQK